MKSFLSIREVRVALAGAPRPVGFVPTMGALHEGHASLVRRCREECSTVVAGIFVNPTQFGEGEDLERYPRDLEGDSELLDSLGTDVLFTPGAKEIYPEGFAASIDIGSLATIYEGAERPGHFAGVCTVVLKLFHIVGPNRAYFGRKDAQQLAVVQKMVRDLDLGARGAVPQRRGAGHRGPAGRRAGLGWRWSDRGVTRPRLDSQLYTEV